MQTPHDALRRETKTYRKKNTEDKTGHIIKRIETDS